MKEIINAKNLSFFVLSLIITSCISDSSKQIKNDFISPPPSAQTGVYWYWMSDNISREGVVKDLHALKQAGINSVFIGNIGGEGTPYGDVKLFSDEWWEVLHTALKTAGELDIEVGMFNCPGWSHSGGPWIEPHQAMRHLIASETRVSGPGKVSITLPVPPNPTRYRDWSREEFVEDGSKPSSDFQDVKVLAFPVSSDYFVNLFETEGAKVVTEGTSLPAASEIYLEAKVPASSPLSPRYRIKGGRDGNTAVSVIHLKLPKSREARSLAIYPSGYCRAEAKLQAKINGQFVSVATFPVYRVFPIPSTGAVPYAPVIKSFAATTSDEFKLIIRNSDRDAALGKITLSPATTLDFFPEKTLDRVN
ncbi:MAG: hypothetical protein LBR18_07570, partial [Tannerella sp.]|nr:hypothetical protein [Tannerella sp.]